MWLATDMSLSRQVAVKILKSTLATDPVVAERFRREAITVARLSHPNIVAVHDTIDFDGRQAVVMQLVNGKSLRQLLDEQKRLGPELTIDPEFQRVPGTVTIERAGAAVWTQEIASGEAEMCHSLQNIEHHHFKFEPHRRPGDVHVHYYGACALSFGAGVQLADGDIMSIEFAGFGRALRNPLRVQAGPMPLVAVEPIA